MKNAKRFSSLLVVGIVLVLGVSFSGCSAMKTAIQKRDLDVQTKMSQTIFLEPVSADNKIIYLDIRNTSDKEMNVKNTIETAFKNKGYRITLNPNEATYMLQGNILKVGKSDIRESQSFAGSSFGAGITGAATGVVTVNALGGSGSGSRIAGVALAGAALGFLADVLVEDTLYVMVTDLQIRERPLSGEVITQTQQANLAQGSSTRVQQDIKGANVKWKTYRTRIVSAANKMNLEFQEAKPVLESALSRSISGVF